MYQNFELNLQTLSRVSSSFVNSQLPYVVGNVIVQTSLTEREHDIANCNKNQANQLKLDQIGRSAFMRMDKCIALKDLVITNETFFSVSQGLYPMKRNI